MSALLAGLGLDITFGLVALFGPDWREQAPEIVIKYGPGALYLSSIILMFRWVRKHFFSHDALKTELERAISNLGSGNIHLRIHAIHDILDVSRKSRRLHGRAIGALTAYLRERHPAPPEEGRAVVQTKQRFGPPTARTSQNWSGGIHEFAETQFQRTREQLSDDAVCVVEALARRRRFFDDPRRWIDLSFTNLPSANFEGVTLTRASFVGANLRGCAFQGARLQYSVFSGAILNDAFMTGAKLRNATFALAMCHRLHLDRANIKKANFFGTDLYNASIQRTDARAADFMGAQMWRVGAGKTNFAKAVFLGARIDGADFHRAKKLTKEQIDGPMGVSSQEKARLPWSTDEELRAAGLVQIKPKDK